MIDLKLNVLYQFNEKYATFAGVSITSLLENNKKMKEINVYILGEALTEESVNKLQSVAAKYKRNIIFKETETVIERMKEWGIPSYRGAYSANLRLFLPLILEENELDERILYLDADTIVASPLDELINIDMQEYALAMSLDSLGARYKETIGLRADELYYNSGVILFEMRNWRKKQCTERIIDYLKTGHTHFASPDQDLLNIVCQKEIKCISACYNLQPVHLAFRIKDYYKCYGREAYYDQSQLEEAINDTVVFHCFRFLGEFPWHYGNLHPDNDLFDQYLAMSPWSDYVKRKAEAGILMKIEKILFRFLPHMLFLRLFVLAHNIYAQGSKEIA